MNSENIRNFTESLKNIILAIAIIVGGVWTLYVFDSKLEVENAKTALEKVNRELIRRPVLSGSLKVDIVQQSNNGAWFIITKVFIKNSGNTDTFLDLHESSLGVAKVNFQDGIIVSYENPIYTWDYSIPFKGSKNKRQTETLTILAGQSKVLTFINKIELQGFYQVQFTANLSQSISDARKLAGDSGKSDYTEYSVTEYIVVGNDPTTRWSRQGQLSRFIVKSL